MVPDGYNSSLDAFRKLLLIRSWCSDRTIPQAKKYIMDSIGERYVDGVILDIEKMVEESEPLMPLICFLSMGSDPSPTIESCGKRKGDGPSRWCLGYFEYFVRSCHHGETYCEQTRVLYVLHVLSP